MKRMLFARKVADEHMAAARARLQEMDKEPKNTVGKYPIGVQVWVAFKPKSVYNARRKEAKKFMGKWKDHFE